MPGSVSITALPKRERDDNHFQPQKLSFSLYHQTGLFDLPSPPGTPHTREDLPLMSDNQVVDQSSFANYII